MGISPNYWSHLAGLDLPIFGACNHNGDEKCEKFLPSLLNIWPESAPDVFSCKFTLFRTSVSSYPNRLTQLSMYPWTSPIKLLSCAWQAMAPPSALPSKARAHIDPEKVERRGITKRVLGALVLQGSRVWGFKA